MWTTPRRKEIKVNQRGIATKEESRGRNRDVGDVYKEGLLITILIYIPLFYVNVTLRLYFIQSK